MQKRKFFIANLIFLGLSFTSPVKADADVDLAGYYLGRDNLAILTSGTYKDLANPNAGKSTLLLQHIDHYHGMGVHSYSGAKEAPTIMDTNANNRIPEISSLEAPLALTLGEGLYADKLVSNRSDSIYSNLSFQFVDALEGKPADSVETILLNSSAKRWNTLMKDASIGLELISATPGLFIGDDKETNVLTPGNTLSGDFLGNRFKPVFWVAKDAPVQTYTAEFRLVDLNDPGKN
ncbi:MAG: all3515 family Zur-repressed PEP-CTERM protein, partial [Methylobacter sp.]|nr:all3515 family Zur-repressed PEP-CTERM protein [Methylobacter sp.]